MLKKILLSLPAVAVAFTTAYAVEDITLAHRKDNAEMNAEEIITMRSTLARNFIKPGMEITEDTFKSVCGAVGKRVKEIMEKEGVVIRHAAIKYRNPANKATDEEASLIKKFDSDRKKRDLWDEVTKDGRKYYRYTRPMFVEDACLACHGEKAKRPKFIVEKYPEDRAFDFKIRDMRGTISVLVPAEK